MIVGCEISELSFVFLDFYFIVSLLQTSILFFFSSHQRFTSEADVLLDLYVIFSSVLYIYIHLFLLFASRLLPPSDDETLRAAQQKDLNSLEHEMNSFK